MAKNLDIPGGFDALKAKVTGSGAVSLGKAIEGFAPDADAKAEAKKANKQASDDLKESKSQILRSLERHFLSRGDASAFAPFLLISRAAGSPGALRGAGQTLLRAADKK